MTTRYAQAAVPISGDLIAHVRLLYHMAKEKVQSMDSIAAKDVYGAHLAQFAIPAFIVAVASVESFLNEVFLSDFALINFAESKLPADSAEKLELGLKLILLPHFAFGKTLHKDEPPYQDMALLIQLRNELVHYKMRVKPPKLVKDLAQRKIAVPVPHDQEKGGPIPWADRVCTLEGIRWAHNTVCSTVDALVNLAPNEKELHWVPFRQQFNEIPMS